MNLFKKVYNVFVDYMFPYNLKCYGCDVEIDGEENKFHLCKDCFSKIKQLTGKTCLKCGEPLFSAANYCLRCKRAKFNFEKAFSYCSYYSMARTLIKNFKFNNKPYISKSLSYMLYTTYVLNILPKYKIDCVTYVPMHSKRLKERGYNQSELLAVDFCRLSKLKLYKNILVKHKATSQQVGLNNQERKTNLKKAFSVLDRRGVRDKTILLIDDIFTTGSTCDECAGELLKAGAYKVLVLTVAHTELNKAVIKKAKKKWKLSHLFQTKHYVTHI